MKYIKYLAALLLIITGSSHRLMADDFDPTNPAEPYQYNKLTMEAEPAAAVSSLSGAGYYKEGTVVTLKSSCKSTRYTFSHWEKDGEWYSDAASPTYTMENDAVTFTAVYDFTPASPDEPELDDNRLYLVAEPLTACTFNKESGLSYEYEQTVSLRATANTGYTFLGWYDGGTLMSESLSFSFNMPEGDMTLTARFEYNPTNPAEPESDGTQTDVQTTPTGDANGDGVVNVTDAVYVINVCLGFTTDANTAMCDANGDGVVNVTDAVSIINICLKLTN